ncbi:nucleotide sugar dehydrogenase [Candidatus Auribacterota bacterium]
MDLRTRIINKRAKIAVIGLGYVGLPLAIEYAKADFSVFGIDLDHGKINKLKRCRSYIEDISDRDIKEVVHIGRLNPTTDIAVLQKADAVIICVPTPLRKTQDPDVSYIIDAAQKISENSHAEQLIILESTTYPGTCEEVVYPILANDNRCIDKDFYLAFSPERIDPGNKSYTTNMIPKVIGGVSGKSTEMAVLLYGQIMDKVVPVSSARVAEMVKLLENTFRSVNIGLVNEIALMCDRMDMDVWEVIDAAATKPFGFIPFYPGPGLGGHCLPVDPIYLSWKAGMYGFEARFIQLASRVNSAMPRYVVNKTAKILNERKKCVNGSNILILGVAYKKDVSDVRESPAIDVIGNLNEMGAHVTYHDPFVDQLAIEDRVMKSVPLTKQLLKKADCVMIVADHSNVDYEFVLKNSDLVFDTRNALSRFKDRKKIARI